MFLCLLILKPRNSLWTGSKAIQTHASEGPMRIMVSSIRMECTEPLLTRNLPARKENLWTH
jgi:hypothetical protein